MTMPDSRDGFLRWQDMSLAPKGHVTEDAACRGNSEWFLGRPSAAMRDGSSPPFVVIRRRSWPHEDSWEGHGEVYYSPGYFDGWAEMPAALESDTPSNEDWIIAAIIALRPFANMAECFKPDDSRTGLSFTTPNLSPRDFYRAKEAFDSSPPHHELEAIDLYVAQAPTAFDRKIREGERDRLIRSLGRKSPSTTDIQARPQSAPRTDLPDLLTAYKERGEELERALDLINSIYIYANDTLSGRVDGPDDREWQRQCVVEVRNRARQLATAESAVEARAALQPKEPGK